VYHPDIPRLRDRILHLIGGVFYGPGGIRDALKNMESYVIDFAIGSKGLDEAPLIPALLA
jgi:hypothetical protein